MGEGIDKALVAVDGVAMGRRVADALRAGGAGVVFAVGGDAGALSAIGLDPMADLHPGEGPLGGICTALAEAARRRAVVLVVAPCDQPWLDGPTVARLVDAVTGAPSDGPAPALAVVATASGPAPLPLAVRVDGGVAAADAAFVAGERSARALLDRCAVAVVEGVDHRLLADVDEAGDLHRR